MMNAFVRDDVNLEIEVRRFGDSPQKQLLIVNVDPKNRTLGHHDLHLRRCQAGTDSEIL